MKIQRMPPALSRLNFTAHVTTSVAWIGAVASFLVLSLAGLTGRDAETVRGAYLAMNLIGGFLIVPLSLAAFLTGIVQSLGTPWGLFRHYWILVKFALTIGATVLLLMHQFTAVEAAARRVSGNAAGTFPEVGRLGVQLVADSGFAVLVLLLITTLAVYKPWGKTRYGKRREREESPKRPGETALTTQSARPHSDEKTKGSNLPLTLKIFLAALFAIVAAFVLLHLAGGGLGDHGH